MQRQLAQGLTPADLNTTRAQFRNAVHGLNEFGVQAVRATSATTALTESIIKQNLGFKEAIKQRRLFNGVLREQYQLQKMTAVQWATNAAGTVTADVIVPRGTDERIDRMTNSLRGNLQELIRNRRGTEEFSQAVDVMRTRIGLATAAMNSGAESMIKWGKNTQWAGRQLMVGFTMPVLAFGAVAGVAAYQVDKQMTRIQKVYDTTANTVIGKQKELDVVRKESMAMGTQVAKRYGVALQDTLEVEAELAATGLRGQDLTRGTAEVVRAATLGEIEYADAVKATIALQSVYGYTTEQLAESFDYLNSLENATNLSMKDMIATIPRASGPLAALDVTLQETGVLMAAMKSRGIEAAQGANALKSGLNRVLNPSKKVQESLNEVGIDMNQIVNQSGGKFMKILQQLSAEMEGMDKVSRQRIIGQLFGTYQFSRINAILQGLEEINDETTQVGRAFKVSQQSASEWGATASHEMQKLQNSASGKFKAALETLKAEIAEIGKPFLEVGGTIVGWIGNLLSWLNQMPDAAKKAFAWGAVFTAIIGPVIMLVGLMANLAGHAAKALTGLMSLFRGFRPMTVEQRAQQMLAERSAIAWSNQGAAAQALSGQLRMLTASMEQVALAQRQMANPSLGLTGIGNPTPNHSSYIGGIGPAAPPQGSRYTQTPGGRYRDTQTGRFVSASEAQAYASAQAAGARSAQQAAQASGETRRNWGGIATAIGAVAIVGTTFAAASGSSSEMLNNITNMVFMAALLGPMLVNAFRNSALANAMSNVTGAFGTGRRAGRIAGRRGVGAIASGLSAAIGPARTLLMTFLRFAGPVGAIASAVFLFAKLYGSMKRGIEAQRKIGASAKDWADVLGFVYREAGRIEDAQGNQVLTLDAQVNKLKEKNAELVKYLQGAREAGEREKAITLAIEEGIKARNHGASAAQAEEVTKIALRAAGFKSQEIEDEIMPEIKMRVDFSDAKQTLKEQMRFFEREFGRVAGNEFGQGTLEGFVRAFSGRDEINNNAAEKGKALANEFWTGFQSQSDARSKRVYFDQFVNRIKDQQQKVWRSLAGDDREDLREVGINTWERLAEAFADAQNMTPAEFNIKWGDGSIKKANEIKRAINSIGPEGSKSIGKTVDAEKLLARELAKTANVSDKNIKKIQTIADLRRYLDMATMSVTEAEKAYNAALGQQDIALLKMNKRGREAAMLKILNQYRVAAGLRETTNLEDGFGKATQESTDKLKKNSQALKENAVSAEDYNNARREAMSGARDMALSAAEDIWQKQADAQVNAIEQRGQRREDALDRMAEQADDRFDARAEAAEKRFDNRAKSLDRRWDNIMERHEKKWEKRQKQVENSYDRRIQKIKDQIKAEEKAEETRQRIFEAEKTRLERMASMANSRIDFQVAMNTGNLDEAAKLVNNMSAEQASWSIDDASESSASSSELRKAKMEGKITTLEAARDKRIQSLQRMEEAEKKALERKREREREALQLERERFQKALEAERERYRKGIEAQRKAIQEQTRLDVEAKRRELERQKRTLELELLAIRASTPRNKKEYDKQIAQIEGAYKKYGVRLKGYGKDWTEYIGKYLKSNVKSAANKLDNDIKWGNIGGQVTKKMIDGGFSMSTREFMKWVTTGSLPNNYAGPGKKRSKDNAERFGYRHTGGPVGGGTKYDNRGGRHWGAGLRRDERPMILKNNEYVLNEKAHRGLGTDFLDGINKTGTMPKPNTGGLGLFSGPMAAAIAGAFTSAAKLAVDTAGQAAMMMGIDGVGIPGMPGMYGNVNLSAEQLKNAATIIGVGKSMGASQRDLVIAIMTAMQESTLRNLHYGDRDSQGLFQQRPSQGWGTVQQITTPSYAARKFFEQLLALQGRDNMPLTLAAQAVQRSAYPYAYAKWADMARAVVSRTGFEPFAGTMGIGRRGWRKPVSGRVSQEWSRSHGGMDFAVPTGTPVRAANAGRVAVSRDLRGPGGYYSYGRYVVLDHGGNSSLYAHLSSRGVRVGQRVGSGTVIGRSGSTGRSTGPHLHFETRGPGGFPGFNPRSIIPGLATGGFTLNDGLAMLHKKETVLTAPLSEQLKSGIQKIDQGVNNEYTISVTFTGPVNSEIDVEKAVTKAINKRESKLGRSRSIA